MNKIVIILAAMLLAAVGGIIYYTLDDGPETSAGKVVIEDEETDYQESLVTGTIMVNNNDWGYVQIVPNSYTGHTVVYEAVAREGCSFIAWFDTDNRYIELNSRISSADLDENGTIAMFIDHDSGKSTTVNYTWNMPRFTFDSRGNMEYTKMVYTYTMADADYERYSNMDVHRKAALGNVYLTPWELVVDDPAVQDMVDYLTPLCDGLNNIRTAWVVMCFVQDVIRYQTDQAQYGSSEYWAFPIEAVRSGYGDCEDTAVMFCAIGSKMGLDTGLVSFSYSDVQRKNLGHMGAAFALVGTEDVSADNNPKFQYMGRTYCYVETATDSRLEPGYLLKYPDLDAYLIADGGFTHIIYSETGGFSHEPLVSIGTSYDTSSVVEFGAYISEVGDVVYGDDFSNPPALELCVGDSFSYIPRTNLECAFSATGDGLVSNGGPFTFDPATNELSGKVTAPGQYHVVIRAETVSGPLQMAYQYITFNVVEPELPNYGGAAKSLNFVNGTWNVDTIKEYDAETAEVREGDSSKAAMIVLAVFLAGASAALILRRLA